MNVLASIHLYPPEHLCGAEFFLHGVLKHLQKKGHTVKVLLHHANYYKIKEMYVYDGVDVFPPDQNNIVNLFRWCDCVFTHLDYTNWTIHMAMMNRKPVFHLIHNTHKYLSIENAERPQFIVYNSEASKKLLNYSHDSIVVHPPVDYRHYEGERGDCITLINLNENKGSDIFYRIAERMGDRKFLGVMGSYDDQLTGKILEYEDRPVVAAENFQRKVYKVDKTPDNVEIIDKQVDIRNAYRRTRILLMPSRYESYGRTGPEAMASGIPVICTSTFGTLESCGKAGIYIQNREDIDEWIKAIRQLDKKEEYNKASKKAKQRAMELDPEAELDRLELWAKEKTYSFR